MALEIYVPRPAEGVHAGRRTCQQTFFAAGSRLLVEFLIRCLIALPAYESHILCQYLKNKGPTSIGTMCSGTDAPVISSRALAEAVNSHFSLGWNFVHEFSSEKKQSKQQFIQKLCPVSKLYRDCCELRLDRAFDVKAGEIAIPKVALLFAGIPCQDVSRQAVESAVRRADVIGGGLRTGTVFALGVLGSTE